MELYHILAYLALFMLVVILFCAWRIEIDKRRSSEKSAEDRARTARQLLDIRQEQIDRLNVLTRNQASLIEAIVNAIKKSGITI